MQNRSLQLLIFTLMLIPGMAFGQTSQTLSLDDCIKQGLEHNQSLVINRFETDRSISQAKSNISMVLPNINYSLSGSGGETNDLGWKNGYNSSLSISQNIWDGGQWWNIKPY